MKILKKNQTYKFTPKMIEELRVVSEAVGIKKNTIVELGTAQKLAELKRNELFTQNRPK